MPAIGNEDSLYAWALAAIFLLAVFQHSFQNIFAPIMLLFGIAVAFFLLKGVFNMLTGRGDMHLWTGVVFAAILILFFNGLPAVITGIAMFVAVITAIASLLLVFLTTGLGLLVAGVLVFLAIAKRV